MINTLINVVDVAFPVQGIRIPLDHGYAVFSALSRLIPRIHEEPTWGVHPVFGTRDANGTLALNDRSMLKLRVPSTSIGDLLPLAGATLDIDGAKVHVAPPRVFPLLPAAYLKSRLVTIKGFQDSPEVFMEAARRQLAAIVGREQEPATVDLAAGKRRMLTVSGKRIIGFEVALGGLAAPSSIAIQSQGIGGRRHMGAGLFIPQRYR